MDARLKNDKISENTAKLFNLKKIYPDQFKNFVRMYVIDNFDYAYTIHNGRALSPAFDLFTELSANDPIMAFEIVFEVTNGDRREIAEELLHIVLQNMEGYNDDILDKAIEMDIDSLINRQLSEKASLFMMMVHTKSGEPIKKIEYYAPEVLTSEKIVGVKVSITENAVRKLDTNVLIDYISSNSISCEEAENIYRIADMNDEQEAKYLEALLKICGSPSKFVARLVFELSNKHERLLTLEEIERNKAFVSLDILKDYFIEAKYDADAFRDMLASMEEFRKIKENNSWVLLERNPKNELLVEKAVSLRITKKEKCSDSSKIRFRVC